MKKTLVLIDSLYEQYGLPGEEENSILFLPMLRGNISNRFLRGLRKVHLSVCAPMKAVWLGRWIKVCKNYDTIILADAGNTFNVVNYINKRWPDKRVIVWYRNSVSATISPNDVGRGKCELWSFDSADCKKYHMKYNPQFYVYSTDFSPKEIQYDVFFVGQDKGRLPVLRKMEEMLNRKGLSTKFCIVGVNSPRLSYKKILDYISQSRVVLDCRCSWQEGITLRPLEALFYHKKLITDDVAITGYDFYNPDNIFIWNKDDVDSLTEFVKGEYHNVNEDVVKRYGLEEWVRRFQA